MELAPLALLIAFLQISTATEKYGFNSGWRHPAGESKGAESPAVGLLPDGSPGTPHFPLVADRAADIVIPADCPEMIRIAARDLAADVEQVSGKRPGIVTTSPPAGKPRIAIGLAPDLAGRWEAFGISCTADTLRVRGSDYRGLAFGIYEISRMIGVSPWKWWADVPVPRHSRLYLGLGEMPVDQPAVRYRGIFINDEDWGLEPWARKTYEPEAGTIGPKTYSRIFELMLRLRANTLWPAMHECTKPFFTVPGNAAAADAYGIIIGSSHAEPMLRNNVGEWKDPPKSYNYMTNRNGVLSYWDQRVRERSGSCSLFTMGMRGIHDSPIIGPKTQRDRIATLERVFKDQSGLLEKYFGANPDHAVRIFCPYKEVLADYQAGLRVPDNATIVFPDDNFGYIRRFPTADERKRPGGMGVYYHLSYLGAPLSWLWIDSQPLPLVWSELVKTYQLGTRDLWIANVGDLKSTEISTSFFLDLAWHADRTTPEAPGTFLRETAALNFGDGVAERIAGLWKRYQALSFARKPEHLQWHLRGEAPVPTALAEQEIRMRLAAYAELARDVAGIRSSVPQAAHDAYFELVAYPVLAAAAANQRYFQTELGRIFNARGNPSAATGAFEKSVQAAKAVAELTATYNSSIAGGKWNHIITAYGMSSSQWKSFQPDPMSGTGGGMAPAPRSVPTTAADAPPGNAKRGDFYESRGVVSIDAGHFTGPAKSGAWKVIPGLGRTGCAVTVLPVTTVIDPRNPPRLSYRFYVRKGGPSTIRVRLLPTYPLVAGNGLRLALAIDDQAQGGLADTTGFDNNSREWKVRVLDNATDAVLQPGPLIPPGWHTLHLLAVDTGVVVDKIVVDFGGAQSSYDGPPETRVH